MNSKLLYWSINILIFCKLKDIHIVFFFAYTIYGVHTYDWQGNNSEYWNTMIPVNFKAKNPVTVFDVNRIAKLIISSFFFYNCYYYCYRLFYFTEKIIYVSFLYLRLRHSNAFNDNTILTGVYNPFEIFRWKLRTNMG